MKPARSRHGRKNLLSAKESIQVFCRIRPLPNPDDPACMQVIPPNVLHVSPPLSAYNLRTGAPKDIHYTFKQVFDDTASQKEVFDQVALPLVEGLLQGKNGLLFTYGVTGCGKTYTMTGNQQDTGIMPRSLDVIFNSISHLQARKHVFKPDRLNGFEIQSEADAMLDRQQDLISHIASAKASRKLEKKNSDPDLASRLKDSAKIDNLDEDNTFAVFVTYIEIYNNSVYDLLDDLTDDSARPKPLQAKIVREDSTHNMYVHAVNEVEVNSTDEAFEVFYRGQKRKRMAHTNLNMESSRSHSIFTIRVVQAPLDDSGETVVLDKKTMAVGQLSLVDLAGSERSNRTKNTGIRLREAGNINNSLLTLRTCLELLRENQNGGNKMIPYRDSRLTHLFKNYFDGEGQVAMIICVSPLADEYDETCHVLKFAEMSQEVQITCPTPMRTNNAYTPGRRKANLAYKQVMQQEMEEKENAIIHTNADVHPPPVNTLIHTLFATIPDIGLCEVDNDGTKVITYLEKQYAEHNNTFDSINKRALQFREALMSSEKDKFVSNQEVQTLRALFEKEKERTSNLEARLQSTDGQVGQLKRKVDDYEANVKKLKRELTEKEMFLSKKKIEQEKYKEHYSQKMAQTEERLNKEMERKLRSQRTAMELRMRSKECKLNEVKRILSDDAIVPSTAGSSKPGSARSAESVYVPSTPSTASGQHAAIAHLATPAVRPSARKIGGVAVSNRRHRRSRSVGDEVWLEHRPANSVPLNTVMQPSLPKRKSVTKLTDAKDVTEKTSKYCLMTQNQDSDGDLETRLYKGDVIPTAGGGAQVLFNDVEVLKQISPNASPTRRRFHEAKANIEAACALAIEGHSRRNKR